MKDGKVRRMFMLDGYLDKDTIKYEFDKEYYESLGISLLPFSREKKDYKALIEVLKKWDKEVKSKTLAGSVVKEDIVKDITSKEPFDETVDAITKMINKYETPMCHQENKTRFYTSTLIICSNITRVPKPKKQKKKNPSPLSFLENKGIKTVQLFPVHLNNKQVGLPKK